MPCRALSTGLHAALGPGGPTTWSPLQGSLSPASIWDQPMGVGVPLRGGRPWRRWPGGRSERGKRGKSGDGPPASFYVRPPRAVRVPCSPPPTLGLCCLPGRPSGMEVGQSPLTPGLPYGFLFACLVPCR